MPEEVKLIFIGIPDEEILSNVYNHPYTSTNTTISSDVSSKAAKN